MAVEQRAVAVRPQEQPATRALWISANGNMSPDQARGLGMVGDRYALDPALGEVVILGGKLYITIDGYVRIAEQHPQYDGYELWPLTPEERKAMRVAESDDAWGCRVYRRDRQHPSVGYGRASPDTISMSTIKPYSSELAQKRAMHRALRGSFRARIPSPEDALDAMDERGILSIEAAPDGADKPPKPPSPDWSGFWAAVKQLGVTDEQVHQVLGVASVTEWAGSLEEAYETVRLWRREHVTKPTKNYDLAKLRESYAAKAERAEALEIVVEPLRDDMTAEEIIQLGQELGSLIKFRESFIPSDPGDGVPV